VSEVPGPRPSEEAGADGSNAQLPDAGSADGGAQMEASTIEKKCLDAQAGAYCGEGGRVQGGQKGVLYACSGIGPPKSEQMCSLGCQVKPPGSPDQCAVAAGTMSYKFPWSPATSMRLTQDCNDSCCQDHIGDAKFAWDFATAGAFTIVAARGGTIRHLKINSTSGCGSTACVNQVNYLVIDHGDGTQATYMHLAGNSLAAGISCGAIVKQGQALATAGTTGWSTGVHLHFQVNSVNVAAATCACGADGRGCSANAVQWNSFWSTAAHPTLALDFSEWPASACSDRGNALPASQNAAP
jgi:hypothetical protein